MPIQVVNNAMLMCSFGTSPSNLVVVPAGRPVCNSQPAANIQDFAPMVNITPFGMCSSIANPQVAAATSAAMGVLTPQPCIPATSAPWVPGGVTMVAQQPTLDSTCTCNCMWAGMITISDPGSTTQVP
jgi:hypothetical protein